MSIPQNNIYYILNSKSAVLELVVIMIMNTKWQNPHINIHIIVQPPEQAYNRFTRGQSLYKQHLLPSDM